jgi:methyltransferase
VNPTAFVIPGLVLVIVLVLMGAELLLSQANERVLRGLGAREAPDPVYPLMRLAYPGAFLAMGIEGALWGPAPDQVMVWGMALFVAAKAFKAWAIASLGRRWTYRVLVVSDAPLVDRGPYAMMRHPNYVAVVGELVAVALMVGARVSGPVMTIFFAELMRRRIVAEEKALGIRHRR